MTFGRSRPDAGADWHLDQSAVDQLVHGSLDAAINFIDTAEVYSGGESETILGKALSGKRHAWSSRPKCVPP